MVEKVESVDVRMEAAPLAGFSDAPWRLMCAQGGADRVWTEMVSAAALAHGSSPTHHLMETMEGEGPVVCQLFGSTEEDLAKATVEVSGWRCADGKRFAAVNLNAGCPMTKVTKSGAGAKLVETPGKIFQLLKAMKENTDLPVSLKTRLGPHPGKTNIFEIVSAAEVAGASEVILHARYTSQMHGGERHLDVLKEVVEKSRIPIVGNGSVVDKKSFLAMVATGVCGVMIGRAALGEPGIFRRLKTGECSPNPIKMHLRALLAFREQLEKKYPKDHIPSVDGYASLKMRTHLFRYFSGRPGAAKMRAAINSIHTLNEIYGIIEAYGQGRDI